MKNIIKTWLKDHQIELPEERIDMLITMLKSRENDLLQQERERIIEEIKNYQPKEYGSKRDIECLDCSYRKESNENILNDDTRYCGNCGSTSSYKITLLRHS